MGIRLKFIGLALCAYLPSQSLYAYDPLQCQNTFAPQPEEGLLDAFKNIFFGKEKITSKKYITPRTGEPSVDPILNQKQFEDFKPTTPEKPSDSIFAKAQREMIDLLKANQPEHFYLREFFMAKWLNHVVGRYSYSRTISFSIGNGESHLSAESAASIRSIVEGLVESGYLILYDADASSAPIMSKFGGANAIGISSHAPNSDGSVVQLSNPYLKMKVLGSTGKVVISSDSVTGLGLLIDGKVGYVFDPTMSWTDGYTDWAFKAFLVFGVDSKRLEVFKVWNTQPLYSSRKIDVKSFEEELDLYADLLVYALSIDNAKHYSAVMSNGTNLMRTDSELNIEIPQGGVVFGSARMVDEYTQLVYDSSYFLGSHGVTIVTGGAGGFMEVANAGAFDAGAQSIGIPLDGGLKTEKRVASETHTQTIGSSGYETRIPLLLTNRNLVILAPGGSGTMNELAVTFVKLGAESKDERHIAFLSSDYYGKLYQWLKGNEALPVEFRNRLHLIEQAEDFGPILQAIESKNFRNTEPMIPRREKRRSAKDFSFGFGLGFLSKEKKEKDSDTWRRNWD